MVGYATVHNLFRCSNDCEHLHLSTHILESGGKVPIAECHMYIGDLGRVTALEMDTHHKMNHPWKRCKECRDGQKIVVELQRILDKLHGRR